MVRISGAFWFFFLMSVCFFSCKKEETPPASIDTLSISLNGGALTDGATNVSPQASIVLVFSATLDPAGFESQLSLQSSSGALVVQPVYSNQSSKVTLDLTLDAATTYTLEVGSGAIGPKGETLANALSISFTTQADGTINSQPPCISGSADCLETVSLTGNGTADFQFFASFPIYEEMAEWIDLKAAIIVLHGANRNADDYFNYLMGTLRDLDLEEEVVLIAPFFKSAAEAEAGEFYWADNSWREGDESSSAAKLSSFTVVDSLLRQLADGDHFPALQTVVVTGHSSGALFTHLYSASNPIETAHPNLDFQYIVANSQYFYYPDGQRINEGNNELYTPTGCTGYDIWPHGYNVLPTYLSATPAAAFNDRFLSRSVTYLLGNGTGPDPTLNTTNCFATLLGSSRFKRGENMFQYLELAYPTHQHRKTIVEGIGHDGENMYDAPEFRALLLDLLD